MSIDGWVNKQNVVYPYNGRSYNLRKEGILTPATTWANLEDVMLSERSERSQTQKDKYCVIPLIWGTKNSQS